MPLGYRIRSGVDRFSSRSRRRQNILAPIICISALYGCGVPQQNAPLPAMPASPPMAVAPPEQQPAPTARQMVPAVVTLREFLALIDPSELSTLAEIDQMMGELRQHMQDAPSLPPELINTVSQKLQALGDARTLMMLSLRLQEVKVWWWLAQVYEQFGETLSQQEASRGRAAVAWNDARMAYARVLVRINRLMQTPRIPAEDLERMTHMKSDAQEAYYEVKERSMDVPMADSTPRPPATSRPTHTPQIAPDRALVFDPEEVPYQWHPVVSVPPIDGMIEFGDNGRFGAPRRSRGRYRRRHQGVDLYAKTGTMVRAVAAGEVVFAGRKGGYGEMVILRHPQGYFTLYAHNKRNLVRKQEIVRAGAAIALVGRTGNVLSTGPTHLHFEIRRGGDYWRQGKPLNPLSKAKSRFVEAEHPTGQSLQTATSTPADESVNALRYFKAQLQEVGNALRGDSLTRLVPALSGMMEAYDQVLAHYPGITTVASSGENGTVDQRIQNLGKAVQSLYRNGNSMTSPAKLDTSSHPSHSRQVS